MSDPRNDTVAAAQRRLLEAIASLGFGHDPESQNYIALHFARGVMSQAQLIEADVGLDSDAGVVFCELARLVGAVHRERLEVEAAGGVGLDG